MGKGPSLIRIPKGPSPGPWRQLASLVLSDAVDSPFN